MSVHDEQEREEKRDGIVGDVCEAGLEVVDGVLGIGETVVETTGSVFGSAAEMAGGAVEAIGGAAGDALSGCAGCAPVVVLAFLLPIGLISGHFIF